MDDFIKILQKNAEEMLSRTDKILLAIESVSSEKEEEKKDNQDVFDKLSDKLGFDKMQGLQPIYKTKEEAQEASNNPMIEKSHHFMEKAVDYIMEPIDGTNS